MRLFDVYGAPYENIDVSPSLTTQWDGQPIDSSYYLNSEGVYTIRTKAPSRSGDLMFTVCFDGSEIGCVEAHVNDDPDPIPDDDDTWIIVLIIALIVSVVLFVIYVVWKRAVSSKLSPLLDKSLHESGHESLDTFKEQDNYTTL
eukprot:gnl/Dysnectes_brevis/13835_a32453_92.p1 GENE.gnl/Dysnectes_brevis/13835_a32453_92~~gnl/Dysnectes_brevis/13835_a32453_92.p1  ORF type:complete len:144 (+),score=9.52 gnl/Dysnectes_brevis/13835_a32453_92:474-905(+)